MSFTRYSWGWSFEMSNAVLVFGALLIVTVAAGLWWAISRRRSRRPEREKPE